MAQAQRCHCPVPNGDACQLTVHPRWARFRMELDCCQPQPVPAAETVTFHAEGCFQKTSHGRELPTSSVGQLRFISTSWRFPAWSSDWTNRGSSIWTITCHHPLAGFCTRTATAGVTRRAGQAARNGCGGMKRGCGPRRLRLLPVDGRRRDDLGQRLVITEDVDCRASSIPRTGSLQFGIALNRGQSTAGGCYGSGFGIRVCAWYSCPHGFG